MAQYARKKVIGLGQKQNEINDLRKQIYLKAG